MTGKTIDNMTNCKIIAMNKQNFSRRKIAKHFNAKHATVSRIISRYHEYNTIENLPHPERPSISNERNERSLIRIVKKKTGSYHLPTSVENGKNLLVLLPVLEQLEEYYKNTITCGELLAKNHVYRKNIRKQEKTGV